MVFGWIYLLQTREFVNSKQPIFKFGQTLNMVNRLEDYPKGSILIFANPVKEPRIVETFLKTQLQNCKSICKQCRDLGIEWFQVNDGVSEK